MQRKKILWLTSWYPNKNDRFDGDFIQRHARAAAIYHDVHVIFVTDATIEQPVETEWNYATGLTEQLIYFKRENGFFAKLQKQWRWKNAFRHAIEEYISANGLPELVHVHVPWKAGLMALWMKKKFGTSFIVSEHWGIYNDTDPDNFASKPKLTQRLIREIYKGAATVISVSKFFADCLERKIETKVNMLIPNVVDTTLFFYKKEKHPKFTFIHVSNMVPLKNVSTILKAFKEFMETRGRDDVQLIMVGNRNDLYSRLAADMALLNSSVFFRGEISYQDVAEEMRRSHAFVLFSDSETFSCVTAEALCCGLPVIAASRGALPELVDQTNGILVPDHTKEALVTAMTQLFQKYDSFDQKQIAEQASKKYGYSTLSETFDELYQTECLETARAGTAKTAQNQQGLNKIPPSSFQNPPC